MSKPALGAAAALLSAVWALVGAPKRAVRLQWLPRAKTPGKSMELLSAEVCSGLLDSLGLA